MAIPHNVAEFESGIVVVTSDFQAWNHHLAIQVEGKATLNGFRQRNTSTLDLSRRGYPIIGVSLPSVSLLLR
jgi:hypothetical protein